MVSDRSGASLVACCGGPCGCPVDRPTDDRGAHGAPSKRLDTPHAVSRTIRICSAQPNLARPPACCHRGGRRALLPASWIRLARDGNRCRGRYGRRPHSRRIHPYAATGKKSILRNRPLDSPQRRRVHACPSSRIGPRQAAYSRTLPQRRRMGPWCLWCGVGVPLLLPELGPEYRPATIGPARRNSTFTPEATARSHAALQRTHPGADAAGGVVIALHTLESLGRFVPISGATRQVGKVPITRLIRTWLLSALRSLGIMKTAFSSGRDSRQFDAPSAVARNLA